MKAIRNISVAPGRQIAARIFLWALLFLSFFAYPLGLFPSALRIGNSVFFNLAYSISIPAAAILGLLALPVLLFFRWRLDRLLLSASIVFVIMLLINAPGSLEYADSFLMLLGYVTIPVAAAILLQSGYLSLARFAAWASVLWFVEIILGCIALYRQTEPAGTPGNMNWMAGLLLMLSPWVIYHFIQTGQRLLRNKRAALLLALSTWLFPTSYILYHCHSRAAWLALLLLPAFLTVLRLRRPAYKMIFSAVLIIAALACMAAAYIWFPAPLLRVVEKDIRLPVWTGTGVMIAKHPLGVGSGLYQKEFTPYRRVSSYQQRLYAADMTVHPHNEILNVGAQLGIPALLAFVLMLSQIGRSAGRDPLQCCARISGYFVVILSMFDMLLVQVPTSFLGFFILGLSWPLQENTADNPSEKSVLFIPKAVAALIISVTALIVCYVDVRQDFYLRRGMIKEETANRYFALDRPDESRALLQNAIRMYGNALSPFNTLIPSYMIGRLSMRLPQQTEQAEIYLKQVAAIDPSFSHLNLLFGQLSLQQHDLAAAEQFFTRECALYPRNEKAWQNIYSFATMMSQYDRSIAIDNHLRDIYCERARQNFGANGLDEKRRSFASALHAGNLSESISLATELLDRIHHHFTDPLFLEMSMEKKWPHAIFSGGFNGLDMTAWRLRAILLNRIEKEVGPLPLSAGELVGWFRRTVEIHKHGALTMPETVWKERAGSSISVYLLFAMLCELNQSPAIICLDQEGMPKHAYLLQKKTEQNSTKATIFRVNLLTSDCRAVSAADFKNTFRWIPGQTLVYYPMADFFLRNQILGTLVKEVLVSHPQRPPSVRLLELFTMTGSPPPPLSRITKYCFSGHIQQYRENIEQ